MVLACLLLAAPVLGHVPGFPADNDAPERAVEVPDAVKSWSFYDRVGDGGARYYRFSLAEGERLRAGTFTPLAGAFTPSLVLASPSLNESDDVPPGVVVPEGMGVVVIEGDRPGTASYEPFAPSANYHTATVDRRVPADATFLLAVYEPANRSGPAGVTVGFAEEFSLGEYLTVPFDLLRVHQWEGQPLAIVVGPYLLAIAAGGAILARRRRIQSRSPDRVLGAAGGLLVAASGVTTAVQMALALSRTGPTASAIVTAIFVLVPLLAGGWATLAAWRGEGPLPARTRVGFLVVAVAGLVTWAGYLVGPAALGVAAIAGPAIAGRWVGSDDGSGRV